MQLKEVKRGYTRAAAQYDRLLRFWFGQVLHVERYRQEAIHRLSLKRGDVVLDVGCGSGANFALLEKKIGRRGKIVGMDYTAAMLHEAEQKIKRHGWRNIELLQGDAVQLDQIVKTEVDALLTTYCFSILYDQEKAGLQMIRSVKPGGKIVILDFKRARHPHPLLGALYPLYAFLLLSYGISSPEDLDNEEIAKRWSRWERVAQKHLQCIQQKDFFLGMFFLFSGQVKRKERIKSG